MSTPNTEPESLSEGKVQAIITNRILLYHKKLCKDYGLESLEEANNLSDPSPDHCRG